MRSAFTYQLKGGAIIYVLLISSLISGLLAAFVMIHSFEGRYLQKHEHTDQARENLRAGLYLHLQRPLQLNQKSAFELATDQDSCFFSSEPWGLFSLLHGRAKHGQASIFKSALIGERLPNNARFSLYLSDFRQPLTLVGNTKLKGKIYLPEAGIKTGHIGKISYSGFVLPKGRAGLSKTHSTGLSPSAYFLLKKDLQKIIQSSPDGAAYVLSSAHEEIPWQEEPFYYQSPGDLELKGCVFAGKCVIMAAGEIRVNANSSLTHAIIFGRKIRIEAGFHGTLQAFATEGIEVEAGVKLEYPSFLLLAKAETPARLIIGKNAEIEGALIMDHSLFSAKKEMDDYCLIENDATVWGLLYATHNLDIKGRVMGSVLTDGFLLKTPGGSYRNHLMDAEIRFDGLSTDFVSPLMFGKKNPQLIQWL